MTLEAFILTDDDSALLPVQPTVDHTDSQESEQQLPSLLRASSERVSTTSLDHKIHGVVVGELLALADDGCTPLVRFAGQAGTAAVRACTSVDLRGPHMGRAVVLMFENGDPARPIVMGLLQGHDAWPGHERPRSVEIDVDGERLVVGAKQQLVLRCGKASITLTKAGKVLIEGSYVLSRSTGVNRIKGGSVQLN